MHERYHPRAKRRVRELTSEYADQIDSTLISNAIHDRVPEDEFALELANAVERLTDLEDRANAMDDTGLEQPLRAAICHLTTTNGEGVASDVVRERVEIVVDSILVELEEDIGGWDDAWDEGGISEAKQEIRHIRETGEVFAE